MDTNWNNMEEFLEKYKNTLVIDYLENAVVVLIDIYDGEEDYYWVLKKYDGDIYYSTAVIDPIPLKGYIGDGDYNRIKHTFFELFDDRLKTEIK